MLESILKVTSPDITQMDTTQMSFQEMLHNLN